MDVHDPWPNPIHSLCRSGDYRGGPGTICTAGQTDSRSLTCSCIGHAGPKIVARFSPSQAWSSMNQPPCAAKSSLSGTKRFAGRNRFSKSFWTTGRRGYIRWWNLPVMKTFTARAIRSWFLGNLLRSSPARWITRRAKSLRAARKVRFTSIESRPLPLTEGLPQRWLRSLVWRALDEYQDPPEPWPAALAAEFIATNPFAGSFPGGTCRGRSIGSGGPGRVGGYADGHPGARKALLSKAKGRPCPGNNRLIKPFLAQLGFHSHGHKPKCCESFGRLGRGQPMRRLLQGDVGSGKTVVAACCALFCLESGYDVALMAPTEILAEQHPDFHALAGAARNPGAPADRQPENKHGRGSTDTRYQRRYYTPTGPARRQATRLEPLASCRRRRNSSARCSRSSPANAERSPLPASCSLRPSPRRPWSSALTPFWKAHSAPTNLGLVIIDEQHRFGVAQRETLRAQRRFPHLLVMTATPIPRTSG